LALQYVARGHAISTSEPRGQERHLQRPIAFAQQ
jgi:hypothetical protein